MAGKHNKADLLTKVLPAPTINRAATAVLDGLAIRMDSTIAAAQQQGGVIKCAEAPTAGIETATGEMSAGTGEMPTAGVQAATGDMSATTGETPTASVQAATKMRSREG